MENKKGTKQDLDLPQMFEGEYLLTLLWIFSKSDNFQIKAGLDTMFDFFQL